MFYDSGGVNDADADDDYNYGRGGGSGGGSGAAVYEADADNDYNCGSGGVSGDALYDADDDNDYNCGRGGVSGGVNDEDGKMMRMTTAVVLVRVVMMIMVYNDGCNTKIVLKQYIRPVIFYKESRRPNNFFKTTCYKLVLILSLGTGI